MKNVKIGVLLFVVFLHIGCSKNDVIVEDFDTIKIGNQEWMKSELNITQYQDGSQIQYSKFRSQGFAHNSNPFWTFASDSSKIGYSFSVIFDGID